jgi:hypothetical protein
MYSVVARQSALDKAKAEAKARRQRDEIEAQSALEDFVKEFDADVDDSWTQGGTEGGMLHSSEAGAGTRLSMGRGRRHFTAPRQEENWGEKRKRNLDSFLEEIKRFLEL